MKFILSNAFDKNSSHILLGKSLQELSSCIQDSEEQKILAQRIESGKVVTTIQSNGPIKFIVFLKEEGNFPYANLETSRKAANSLYPILEDLGLKEIALVNCGASKEETLAFCEGLYLTNYSFEKYFTKKPEQPFKLESLKIKDDGINQEDILQLTSVMEATAFTRDLVNEPLSYLTAEKLAEEVQQNGKKNGYSVEVFNKKKIESLKMGGLLAVNKGSVDPPTFSLLEWKPQNAVNSKPYVLVGKGVVFDTGGLSLKPTQDSMDYMKCDMGGAAAVAGAFHAISAAKLPVHVIGLIPATDNRPDGNAYVPGDVVTMHDGSTVEVLNTDAEGRMLLADALSYAKQYDPKLVVELSTLTGSAHMAVGKYAIVGMGNAGEATMKELTQAGYQTFERIAEFPFWDDFAELMKSDIADQKNIGGRYAGAITAGKFLEKFTDYPYVHLDIAGPSFNKQADNYRGKGGSGVGTRLLFEFFKQKSKK